MDIEVSMNFRNQVAVNTYKTGDDKLIEVATYFGSDYRENIISITNQIGCVIKCPFCLVGKEGYSRNITSEEYLLQVDKIYESGILDTSKPIKVSYTRAGEPLLNPHTMDGIILITEKYSPKHKFTSTMPDVPIAHDNLERMMDYVSTMDEEFQFNISMHTTNEEHRKRIIPYPRMMTFDQIAEFGSTWAEKKIPRKINLSFVLMEGNEMYIESLKDIFNPLHFALRFSLYLPCTSAQRTDFPPSELQKMKKLADDARELGYFCIESVAKETERTWHTSPGSSFLLYRSMLANK